MLKREFQDDSDFSVKKFYRRRSIKKRKIKSKLFGSDTQPSQTSGKWNIQETKLYVEFLKASKNIIDDFKCRRQMKIFKRMSQFVKTRTPDQCRSHHQKVQKLHKTIDDIITFYQRKVMFGNLKKAKIHENIVLVGGFGKDEKTTCLIDSEDFFHHKIDNYKLIITIKAQQMAQY